jgi:integrase
MDNLFGTFPKAEVPFGRKSDPRLGHGEASLRLLGLASSTNRSQLSDATVDQAKAHLNVLHRNGIPITAEYICSDPVAVLNGLRDRHGRLLNDSYKRQIGITLKRLFPSQMPTIREYNQSRAQKPTVRDVDPNFLIAVRKMGEYAAKYLSVVSRMGKVEDLAMYDSCLAAVLTMLTSMRIAELHQLTLEHLTLIEQGQRIGIHSKASDAPRAVPLTEALTLVIDLIRKQRPLVETAAKELPSNPQTGEYRVISLSRRMVFTSTIGTMRKKLVAVMSQASVANNTDLSTAIKTVGFNPFRNLLVSTLVDGGGHFIAKALNNHSSLNTTIGNYNIITPQAADDAFRSLQAMSANLRLGPLNKSLKVPPGTKVKTEPITTSKTTSTTTTGGLMEGISSSATTLQQPTSSRTTTTTTSNWMNLPAGLPPSAATPKLQPDLMDLPAGPSSATTSQQQQQQQSAFQATTTTRPNGMTLPAGPESQIDNTGNAMELELESPSSSGWNDFPDSPLVGEPAPFSTFEFPTAPAPNGQLVVPPPPVQPPGQSFAPPPVQPPGQSFMPPPPPIGNQQTSTIVKPMAQRPAQTAQPQRPPSVQQRGQTPQPPQSGQPRGQTPQPPRQQSTQMIPQPRVQTPQNTQQLSRAQTPQNTQSRTQTPQNTQPRTQTPQNTQQLSRAQTPQNTQQLSRTQTPQNIQTSRPSSVQTTQQQDVQTIQQQGTTAVQSSVQTIQQQGPPAVQSRPPSVQLRPQSSQQPTTQTIQQQTPPASRPTSALSTSRSSSTQPMPSRPTSALSTSRPSSTQPMPSRPSSTQPMPSRPTSALSTSRPTSAQLRQQQGNLLVQSRPTSAQQPMLQSTQQNSQPILQLPENMVVSQEPHFRLHEYSNLFSRNHDRGS